MVHSSRKLILALGEGYKGEWIRASFLKPLNIFPFLSRVGGKMAIQSQIYSLYSPKHLLCSYCAHHVYETKLCPASPQRAQRDRISGSRDGCTLRVPGCRDSPGKATGDLTHGLSCERWVRISQEENGTRTPGRGSFEWESGSGKTVGQITWGWTLK